MALDSSSKYLDIKWKSPQEDPPAGVSGAPGENNIMLWNAVIFGPHETPFEVDYNSYSLQILLKGFNVCFQDGTFKLTLEFSEEYPNKPPVVKFLSKVSSRNVLKNQFTLVIISDVPPKHLRRRRHLPRHPPGIRKLSIQYLIPVSSQNRWSPTYDVSAILTSIQSLLSDPNPNSPANSMAAQLFKVFRPFD